MSIDLGPVLTFCKEQYHWWFLKPDRSLFNCVDDDVFFTETEGEFFLLICLMILKFSKRNLGKTEWVTSFCSQSNNFDSMILLWMIIPLSSMFLNQEKIEMSKST